MPKNRYAKRHYEDVAAVLRKRRAEKESHREPSRSISLNMLDEIAGDFAEMFERDYPLNRHPAPYGFDRKRFLTACHQKG